MSDTPVWGTAEEAAPREPREGARGYALVVEQFTGPSDSGRWTLEDPRPAGATLTVARGAALALARNFTPRHPMNETARQIYRLADGGLLVAVSGWRQTFHFRVHIVEVLPS